MCSDSFFACKKTGRAPTCSLLAGSLRLGNLRPVRASESMRYKEAKAMVVGGRERGGSEIKWAGSAKPDGAGACEGAN
jgi:hypothetical protein